MRRAWRSYSSEKAATSPAPTRAASVSSSTAIILAAPRGIGQRPLTTDRHLDAVVAGGAAGEAGLRLRALERAPPVASPHQERVDALGRWAPRRAPPHPRQGRERRLEVGRRP